MQGDFPNSVQSQKEAKIKELGITIWRDHDHMHFDKPDRIFTGVMKYLGWENYFIKKSNEALPLYFPFELPETTVKELAQFLVEKIGLNGIWREMMVEKILRVVYTARGIFESRAKKTFAQ